MLYTADLKEKMTKNLLDKWSWLTEGVSNLQEKVNMSIVLQNSLETMHTENGLNEDFVNGLLEGTINEDIQSTSMLHTGGAGSSALIPKVIFPLIRRVFPNLIANKLVGIQPLTRPTGLIYYLIYKFSNTKGDVVTKDEYDAFPWDGNPRNGYSAYYSSNRIGPFTGTIAASGGATTIVTNVDTFFDQAEVGMTASTRTISGCEVYSMRTGQLYATTVQGSGTPTAGTNGVTVDPTTNVIVLADVNGGTVWTAGESVKIFIIYNQEASEKIPELELTIDSMNISTKARKLKVRWTKESEQDFKAYHQIDIENELVKAAAQEMSYEVDREIIDHIDRTILPELSLYHDWVADAPSTGNNTQGNYLDRHRALADKIMRLSAKIATYNRQGPANWIVCSPQTAAVLQQLPNFKQNELGANSDYNIHYMGTLNSTIEVYADPVRGFYAGAGGSAKFGDVVLVGYKAGNDPYKTGIVYSPYTNWMSNLVVHPDNFNSIRGFFSRYALTTVPRGAYYYGKLLVDNLIV